MGRAKLFVCILYSLSVASPAWSAGTLFEDDFNDGSADGWMELDGTFEVVDGEYHITASQFCQDARAINGDPAWTDYVIDTDFRFDSPSNHAAILFRVQEAVSGCDAGKYYQLYVFATAVGICLIDFSGGNCDGLTEVPHSTSPDVWHHARIQLNGADVEVSIDGESVLTYDGLTAYPTGSIGLKNINSGVNVYDNVVVSALDGLPVEENIRVSSWGQARARYR